MVCLFVSCSGLIGFLAVRERKKTSIMWTSDNDTGLLIKRINKEMCMRYVQMVEEMLWMTDVRRVNLNTGASDKRSTTSGYKFLVLWESGRTEWIANTTSRDRHCDISPESLSQKLRIGLNTARNTLKVTTQQGIRQNKYPITRRYRTDTMSLRIRRLRATA